jgi:hypothetical protein
MTVPENWNFPLHAEKILSLRGPDRERYWRELIFDLKRMYEELAYGINGNLRSYVSESPITWTPTLNGSTTGTFTYDHQVGWLWRQGNFIELWFDVKWTAVGTAANNLYLELPYEVALSDQKPFVGAVQSSGVTYTGGTNLFINAIPDTLRGEFWYTGSGVTAARS